MIRINPFNIENREETKKSGGDDASFPCKYAIVHVKGNDGEED